MNLEDYLEPIEFDKYDYMMNMIVDINPKYSLTYLTNLLTTKFKKKSLYNHVQKICNKIDHTLAIEFIAWAEILSTFEFRNIKEINKSDFIFCFDSDIVEFEDLKYINQIFDECIKQGVHETEIWHLINYIKKLIDSVEI